jgi:hypothetical protein
MGGAMLLVVEVGVSLSRPPKLDRISRIVVECDNEVAGELLACQIAQSHSEVVMAIYSKIEDILEI